MLVDFAFLARSSSFFISLHSSSISRNIALSLDVLISVQLLQYLYLFALVSISRDTAVVELSNTSATTSTSNTSPWNISISSVS